jgi:hypothetical protein
MSGQLLLTGQTGGTTRAAILSPCGRYRYKLSRTWSDGPRVLWVMLNPSTADADKDDPTIRKCIGFSKRWGCGGLDVVNLFAWRATHPKDLRAAREPVGTLNDEAILLTARAADRIVVAWGGHVTAAGRFMRRAERVRTLLLGPEGRPLFHLGLTSLGQPSHPLMLAYTTPLVRW